MVHRARPIAALVGLMLVLAACQGAQESAAEQPDALVIAAVQGNESEGIKALADDYETETGVALQIKELPYRSCTRSSSPPSRRTTPRSTW